MGLLFFPRGGSSHVAQNLAQALPGAGWDVRVVSGSVTVPGRPGDAREFYAGLDVRPVDMTAALDAPDPLRADPPLHPSYEDRPAAADRVMCSLDDEEYEHQVAAWSTALRDAGAKGFDLLHLHHLTPLHEAALRVAPSVPVIGHIHGTELLMLEEAAEHPERWSHSRPWIERMRRWAARCERLIVLSDSQVERVERLLGVGAERCVRCPNGFDPDVFDMRRFEHGPFWRRHLVDEPQGWAPDGSVVAYPEEEVAAAFEEEDPVLLYVGRFTAVKRVSLLIEAYAQAVTHFERPAPLVLLGGFPGEWEREHPLDAVRRTGARDVYLAGWHGHDELPSFLAAADVVVLPSVREQFGQVLVEGMACGLPAIAVDAHGPAEIVHHGRTGWLLEPDDRDALAAALVEAVNFPDERRRRGEAAHDDVRARFAWPALARDVAGVYDEVVEGVRPLRDPGAHELV
jgi:glycosyltransferase involved in cell wall biosynthesis